MPNQHKKGILTVISGPAGSGKGTVLNDLLSSDDSFRYSVSATTRMPRPGEKNGIHYHFMSHESFKALISSNGLLEYTEYCGNYYGTPSEKVKKQLLDGNNVILEIDVVGAMNIKKCFPDAILILLIPPDFTTLEARLRGRGTNTEEDILNRLDAARRELEHYYDYDYVIVNETGKSAQAAKRISAIASAEADRTKNNPEIINNFFKEV